MSDPLRFFVPPASLVGEQVEIDGETFHHLRNVLRARPGQRLLLLDGQGDCCEAELEGFQRDRASARVLRRWRETDATLPITLLQALPKGDKFDLVLQKGTELGIRRFVPVATARAVPSLDGARRDKRQQRWERIAHEAARQSRRSFLPEVAPLTPLAELLGEATAELKLVLWEAGAVPLADALPAQAPAGVRLLVGPEGGFSAEEIATVTAAGYIAVHLGPRILRSETAGLAAAPVLQYLYGDWRMPPGDPSPHHCEESP